MLNKKPIFIVAFTRGGSNILLNLFRSHPQVCSPRGETHQVFKGKPDEPILLQLKKQINYVPIILREGNDVFSASRWEKRSPLSQSSIKRIDQILFEEKLKAREPGQNLYKSENELYTDDEILSSRLLCKNLNGLIFLTDQLKQMYQDASFFALVRNGYAVCEGILRRSARSGKLLKIAKNYNSACQQIIEDTQKIPNYHVYRYEDIINNPLESLKSIYNQAGLDIADLKKVRLETKKVIREDGSHLFINNSNKKELVWYELEDFFKHFMLNANENQIKRLKGNEVDLIRNNCKHVLDYFNY